MADNYYYFTGGFLLAEVVEIGRRRTEQTHPLLLFPVLRHLINFQKIVADTFNNLYEEKNLKIRPKAN